MAFQNRTISEINTLLITQIETQLSQTFSILPKSFIRVLTKVLSGVFIILYKVAGWMFLQIFVSTASFDEVEILGKKIRPLVEWGRMVSAGDPLPATQAEFSVLVNVNSIGETLSAGTQFTSDLNDIIYITQDDYLLDSATETISVIATEGGTAGNLEIGNTLTLANTLGIIENEADITAILTTATDEESEEDYRARVLERFQLQPQGGAYADYRLWAAEVSGVQQTYIYSGDLPTHVYIYVAGDPEIYPDRVPNSALLLAVAEVLEYDPDTGEPTRRPLGAVIDPDGDGSYSNVRAISNQTFDIEVTGFSSENETQTKADIKDALEAYMLEREPFVEGLSIPPMRDKVTQANVIGIVNEIVRNDNGTILNCILSIDGVTTTNYSLLTGELALLGTLTINGVEV